MDWKNVKYTNWKKQLQISLIATEKISTLIDKLEDWSIVEAKRDSKKPSFLFQVLQEWIERTLNIQIERNNYKSL